MWTVRWRYRDSGQYLYCKFKSEYVAMKFVCSLYKDGEAPFESYIFTPGDTVI